jgi:hypothetical protein
MRGRGSFSSGGLSERFSHSRLWLKVEQAVDSMKRRLTRRGVPDVHGENGEDEGVVAPNGRELRPLEGAYPHEPAWSQ